MYVYIILHDVYFLYNVTLPYTYVRNASLKQEFHKVVRYPRISNELINLHNAQHK